MSFQILPNWCKKLGLSVFAITEIATAGDHFMDGLNAAPIGTHHFFIDLFGPELFHILYILPIIGLLIYMLSKEKIEDDFIKILRLESYQLTVVIFLGIALVFYLIKPETYFSLDWFIPLFMLFYLIAFYFKKRANS